MLKTATSRRSVLATSALLLGLLAGVHDEAASQATTVVDAHDQARRLLQRPEITSAASTAAATAVSTERSVASDAQEQARRLLTSDRIVTQEVAGAEAAQQPPAAQRVDAHTVAARLLLKPNAY